MLLQCPKLQSLAITGCSQLESLMLWSDEITELDLTGKQILWQHLGLQQQLLRTTLRAIESLRHM